MFSINKVQNTLFFLFKHKINIINILVKLNNTRQPIPKWNTAVFPEPGNKWGKGKIKSAIYRKYNRTFYKIIVLSSVPGFQIFKSISTHQYFSVLRYLLAPSVTNTLTCTHTRTITYLHTHSRMKDEALVKCYWDFLPFELAVKCIS